MTSNFIQADPLVGGRKTATMLLDFSYILLIVDDFVALVITVFEEIVYMRYKNKCVQTMKE